MKDRDLARVSLPILELLRKTGRIGSRFHPTARELRRLGWSRGDIRRACLEQASWMILFRWKKYGSNDDADSFIGIGWLHFAYYTPNEAEIVCVYGRYLGQWGWPLAV